MGVSDQPKSRLFIFWGARPISKVISRCCTSALPNKKSCKQPLSCAICSCICLLELELCLSHVLALIIFPFRYQFRASIRSFRVILANVGTPHSFMPFDWTPSCFIFIRFNLVRQFDNHDRVVSANVGIPHSIAIRLDTQLFFYHDHVFSTATAKK
jgi:hypothetical protein